MDSFGQLLDSKLNVFPHVFKRFSLWKKWTDLDSFGQLLDVFPHVFFKRFSLKRFLKRCNFKHLDRFGFKVGCIKEKMFFYGNTCKKSLWKFGQFWTAFGFKVGCIKEKMTHIRSLASSDQLFNAVI